MPDENTKPLTLIEHADLRPRYARVTPSNPNIHHKDIPAEQNEQDNIAPRGANLIERARTRRVVLEIQNLLPDRGHRLINIPASPAAQLQLTNNPPKSSSFDDHNTYCHITTPTSPATNGQLLQLTGYEHISSSPPASDPPTPPDVDYPPASDVLQYLHNVMPELDLLQYSSALLDHGIQTVDNLSTASDDSFAAIGIPVGIFEVSRDMARIMALGAEGRGVSAPRF